MALSPTLEEGVIMMLSPMAVSVPVHLYVTLVKYRMKPCMDPFETLRDEPLSIPYKSSQYKTAPWLILANT